MFGGLIEPIEAAFSARESSMIARNQQLIQSLTTYYGDNVINHFIIDNKVSASLSWYLSEREIGCLTGGRADEGLSVSVDRLSEAWNSK
jgi:hypothetical protein